MVPSFRNSISSPRSAMLFMTYFAFSRARKRSCMNGVWIASVSIPRRWIPCPVICETKLKSAFWTTPRKMSPVMNFVGGMYFSGRSGKISRAMQGLARARIRKPFRIVGSISNACPSPICHGRQARREGEALVQELAREDRVRLLDRVGRRQVVVLAGVDDDAGPGVDHPAELLVDERPVHVDVAEEDSVHRVVQHHVEALERPHGRDLGHAEAGGVVRQVDVALAASRRPRRARPA